MASTNDPKWFTTRDGINGPQVSEWLADTTDMLREATNVLLDTIEMGGRASRELNGR